MILIDTQVVVWAIGNDRRLGKQAKLVIEQDEDRRVSAMVAWELAMLVSKNRLTLGRTLDEWLRESLASLNAREVPVTGAIGQDAGSLPRLMHGDPCDRIMVATARHLHCPLLTANQKILRYAEAGHVRVVDARR